MKKKFATIDYLAIAIGLVLFVLSIIVTYADGNRFYNPFKNQIHNVMTIIL